MKKTKAKRAVPISEFTAEAIDILRLALKRPGTRTTALKDPAAVLAKRGISLAENVALRLYEPTHPTPSPAPEGPQEGPQMAPPGPPIGAQNWSEGVAANWAATHNGCPLGTHPYETWVEGTEVKVWGVFLSGKEWVPISDATKGRFEYTIQIRIPLLEVSTRRKVVVCLPRYIDATAL